MVTMSNLTHMLDLEAEDYFALQGNPHPQWVWRVLRVYKDDRMTDPRSEGMLMAPLGVTPKARLNCYNDRIQASQAQRLTVKYTTKGAFTGQGHETEPPIWMFANVPLNTFGTFFPQMFTNIVCKLKHLPLDTYFSFNRPDHEVLYDKLKLGMVDAPHLKTRGEHDVYPLCSWEFDGLTPKIDLDVWDFPPW